MATPHRAARRTEPCPNSTTTNSHKSYLIPAPVIKKAAIVLEQPLHIDVAKTGPGALTADWHLPTTDFALVNQFIEGARDLGATNFLVIAGDYWNLDSLSSFDVKQDSAGLEKEIAAGNQVMSRLLETFDRVILSEGNHDSRLHKVLGYKASFTTAMRMLFHELDPALFDDGRIVISNLDHLILDSPRGPYRVVHPKSYSATPLTGARKLASKHLSHVITGHSHHTAIGSDVSGRYVVAEVGGFFDATRVAYLQRSTSFGAWSNGWMFIEADGSLVIHGVGWSTQTTRSG